MASWEKYINSSEDVIWHGGFTWAYMFWKLFFTFVFCSVMILGTWFFFKYFLMVMVLRNFNIEIIINPLVLIAALILFVYWLKMWHVKYVITDQHAYIIKGLLSKKCIEILYSDISDTEYTQTILDRLFYNAGSIRLNTSGHTYVRGSGAGNVYEGMIMHIYDALQIKGYIDQQILAHKG